MTRARWAHVGAWLVASALVVALAQRVGVARVLETLQAARGAWLAVAVLAQALILPITGLKWRVLLPASATISPGRLFRIVSLTSVANNTTPTLVGHLAGLALLAAEPGVGRAASLSVLALDQVSVGLAKILVFSLTAVLVPLPGWMAGGVLSLALAVAALLVLTVAAAVQHQRVAQWSTQLSPRPLLGPVARLAADWARSLDAIRRPRRFGVGLVLTVLTKVAEAVAIMAVQSALGLEVPLVGVLLVLAATSLVTSLPFVPANLGTYEAGTWAAYRVLGVPPDQALGAALALHACQLLPAVGVGYAMLTLRPGGRTAEAASPQRP